MDAQLFIWAIFGHCAGDYWLQTKNMALNKSAIGWKGLRTCLLHSAIYALAVCLFVWSSNLFLWLAIFISHFILDRWSLAGLWLKFIKGRTFEGAFTSQDKFREFDISFTSLVYAVVDNSFHLFVVWLLIFYGVV